MIRSTARHLVFFGMLGLLGCSSTPEAPAPTPIPTDSVAVARPAAGGDSGALPDDVSGARPSGPVTPGLPKRVSSEELSGSGAPASGTAPDHAGVANDELSGAAPGNMAYDLGRRLGEQTTRSAWANLSQAGGCDAGVDRLGDVIDRASSRIASQIGRYSSQESADYAEGYVHGMQGMLAEIATGCTAKCAVLCDVSRKASQTVFCLVVRKTGGDLTLGHSAQSPRIGCASGDCGALAAVVRATDCP